MHSNRIAHIFSAPLFEDVDKTRTAKLLNIILLTMVAIAAVYLAVGPIIDPNPLPGLIGNAITVMVYITALVLMRRGWVQLASILFSVTLWLMVNLVAIAYGGVTSPAFFSYFTCIVIAGLLLGGWAAISFAGLSIVSCLGLLLAEIAGILPGPIFTTIPLAMWWVATVNFFMVAVLLFLADQSIRKALEQAHCELAKRKRIEDRLRESEEQYRQLMQESPVGIEMYKPDGTLVAVNKSWEKIWNVRAKDVVNKYNPLKNGTFHKMGIMPLIEKVFAGQQVHLPNIEIDPAKSNLPGRKRWVEGFAYHVTDKQGQIKNVVLLSEDITERKQLEEQFRQAQKMEAVGQLTAGIAHDFNNLLTAINGFAGLMQAELPPDEPHQESLDKILRSGQRAADLVAQLLAFSRKQIIEPQVLNLNTTVAEMDKMLRRIIGEDISFETILSPDLWEVKVDPSQIEQVIVNLAVNTRDAMPQGGRLIIETANVLLDDAYVAHHFEAQAGEYILLAISDTGLGISEAVQARLFEPFFTTKEQGKGTGLGLAIVYGIVKQSRGHIRVYSQPESGTTFKIYLPRTEEGAPTASPLEIKTGLPSGSETILLVEDDAEVRTFVRKVLQAQGYTLLEAKEGQEALRLAAQHAGPIHLLLTDVVMPGINGKRLAEKLGQLQPGLKILFMSGYTDNAIVHHGVLDPDVSFLPKPFGPTALARKVRITLDN